jgi:two-component system CheB/CheR fusion protein
MASPKRSSRSAASAKHTPRRTRRRAAAGETPLTPIVGIGSSAGGLEALEAFFRAMPADSGMAFVVVTHQLPDHTSLLPELLGRYTSMPISEVTTGMPVQANQLYLSTPGSYLSILNATLQPMIRERSNGPPLPIDYFLRALAEDQQEQAIGIILSGTGTDGTLGLQAVKGYGGLTLVQAADDAQFPGMPQSALATGVIDHVLPVAAMPQVLLAIAQMPYWAAPTGEDSRPDWTDELLRQLFILLRNRTRHDFAAYKLTTIRRRLERRMAVHQLDTPQQYLQLVQNQPHELDLLFREFLIGVTSFFRDAEAFDFLAAQALPQLLQQHPEHQSVRVWVAGCSTGEEAYSLAIVLRECTEQQGLYFPMQIFATDLDSQSIEKARSGMYPEGIARDVSPERLERFFIHAEGHYTVIKEIREMVVFAEQNVIMDPPFTKLDLLSCRNLLIYLEAEMQRRLLPIFHYALNPQGLLFLGSSETIGGCTDLFTPIDKRWKIFQCLDTPFSSRPQAVFAAMPDPQRQGAATPRSPGKSREAALETLVDKLLVQAFVPPSVLVNAHGDIVFIHGQTGLFLQPAPGSPSHNVFSMAREGLHAGLVTALRQAISIDPEPVQRRIEVQTNGGVTAVDVKVQAVRDPEPLQGLFLITFQPVPVGTASPSRSRRRAQSSLEEQIVTLEGELQETRDTLRSNVEESEVITEEFKSTNEELQSTNEELQSSNEELETAKEELQSLNEELHTVNSELQQKVEELSQTNDDMKNLLNSTDIATLFLDPQLRIKRFTSQASTVIKLIDSDVGRPVADLVSNLSYPNFVKDAQDVVRTLNPKEVEIPTLEGQWYFVRMMPYRTANNMIDGLVITFLDITRQKQAELASHEARAYTENIVETIREALVILDAELRVVSANRAFYRTFQQTPDRITGEPFLQIGNGAWQSAELQRLLKDVAASDSTFENFRFAHSFPDLGAKNLGLNARRMQRAPGLSPLVLLAIEDKSDPSQPGAEAAPGDRATIQPEASCDDPT